MFSMEKKHQQSSSQMQYRQLKVYEIIHFNKNTFDNKGFIIQSIVSSFVKYIDSKFTGSSSSLSSLLLPTVYNIGPIPPLISTKTAKMFSSTNNNNNSKKMKTTRRPKNLFMNSNENCLLIFWLIFVVLFYYQINSCDCFLQTQALRSERKQQQQQLQQISNNNTARITGISNSELAYIRMVRSYSEEFMSSSEERERGLQFFGGSSAGSSSSSSSTTNKRISPYFETESISTNVTISEGSAFVHLPCRVKQLGDRTLSWIRRQDVQILTVGTFTYTSDQRFQVIHRENSDDWSLQISYPRKKDAGIYECQVSTIPKMNLFIQLNVIVSRAKIIEGPVLYLTSGSTLNLTCLVKDTPEPPDYIFWYYNGQVINYGSPRGIKVYTEKSAQTISKLIILKAQANDSGNYSCTPSNAEPAHIAVHIQNNANPAASIQHGKRSASREYGSNKAMSTMMMSPIGPFQMVITIILLLALYLS